MTRPLGGSCIGGVLLAWPSVPAPGAYQSAGRRPRRPECVSSLSRPERLLCPYSQPRARTLRDPRGHAAVAVSATRADPLGPSNGGTTPRRGRGAKQDVNQMSRGTIVNIRRAASIGGLITAILTAV